MKTYFDGLRSQGSLNVDEVEKVLKYCVETNELIAVTGPQGSGKSILMENLLEAVPSSVIRMKFPDRGGVSLPIGTEEFGAVLWGGDVGGNLALKQNYAFALTGNRAIFSHYASSPHGLWHDLAETEMNVTGRGAMEAARKLLQLRMVNIRLGRYQTFYIIEYIVKFVKLYDGVYNLQLLATYDFENNAYIIQ
jgi:energy-coupling factor transporter ATP-binding protein EcfA2